MNEMMNEIDETEYYTLEQLRNMIAIDGKKKLIFVFQHEKKIKEAYDKGFKDGQKSTSEVER